METKDMNSANRMDRLELLPGLSTDGRQPKFAARLRPVSKAAAGTPASVRRNKNETQKKILLVFFNMYWFLFEFRNINQTLINLIIP